MYHMDVNKIQEEKTNWRCHKNATCYSDEGTHGVMVIIVWNEHGGPEFISWMRLFAFSHSINTLGKSMNLIIPPPGISKL